MGGIAGERASEMRSVSAVRMDLGGDGMVDLTEMMDCLCTGGWLGRTGEVPVLARDAES